MPKHILSFLLCLFITIISVFSVGATPYTQNEISSSIDKIISYEMSLVSASDEDEFISKLSENTDNADTQWLIISLSKYGYNTSLLSDSLQVSALKMYYDRAKTTDFQRMAIALTASDVDCENVGGKNFLADSTYNNATINKQGINAYAYALIALNAANVDESADCYIEEILKLQLSDGGFTLTGAYSDVDVTAICIQALAPYSNDNNQVSESIEKAINCLSKKQNPDGGYSSYGSKNCESTAQVISALVSLEIDPQSDSRFIKNDTSAIEVLLKYQNIDGGFSHIAGSKTNSMATVQALKALVDYNDFINTKNPTVKFSEDNDKLIISSDIKSKEKTSIISHEENTNEQSVKSEESEDISILATENSEESSQTLEEEIKTPEKIVDYDEVYISGESDKFVPIPTKAQSKLPQSYSDTSIFIISFIGLLLLFIVLLVIKLIITKKNGEKFSFNLIKRTDSEDEEA